MTFKDKPTRAGGKPFSADRKTKPAAKEAGDATGGKPVREKPRAGATETTPDKAERISKILARAGIASRRDVERMIMEGRVSLNGRVLETPVVNATLSDRIEVDGAPIRGIERTRLWLYHKPAGLVTTNADPEGRPTVFDNLPETLPRVMSIGRLDINTEGLLLVTNDGGLARVLELPATGWLRRYRVRAHGDIDQAKLDTLKDGIAVDGVLYGGIDATLDRTQGHNVWITMGLREGKNREIKNVLGALGLEVNRLIRISYGPFQLADLPEGEVLEVRGKTLRDQLGPRLIDEAKANFDAPIYDATVADDEETPAGPGWKAETRTEDKPARQRTPREKPGDKRERALGRLDTRPDDRKSGDRFAKPGRDGEARPTRRGAPGQSRTSNVWMAPGARPVAEKTARPKDAEQGEKRAPRSRPADAPASKRYGRTKDGAPVRSKGKFDPDSKGGRSFARLDDDGPRVVVKRAEEDSDWIRADAPASKPRDDEGGRGGKRSFGDKPARGDRPAGDRPRGDRPFGDRPRGDKPFGDRKPRAAGDDRPRTKSFAGEARSAPRGDKPFGAKPRGDRPFADKPRGDRPFADRKPRAQGDERPRAKSFSGDERSERAPRGDKPFGAKPFGTKPRGDRSFGDKPRGNAPRGDKPFGDKPRAKPFGARPAGEKTFSGKPRGDRPEGGDTPRGGKPGGGAGGVRRGADRRR